MRYRHSNQTLSSSEVARGEGDHAVIGVRASDDASAETNVWRTRAERDGNRRFRSLGESGGLSDVACAAGRADASRVVQYVFETRAPDELIRLLKTCFHTMY